MQFIRDISDSLGVQGYYFNILIIIVVVTGGIWAAIRLYQDFTRPLDEDEPELNEKRAE